MLCRLQLLFRAKGPHAPLLAHSVFCVQRHLWAKISPTSGVLFRRFQSISRRRGPNAIAVGLHFLPGRAVGTKLPAFALGPTGPCVPMKSAGMPGTAAAHRPMWHKRWFAKHRCAQRCVERLFMQCRTSHEARRAGSRHAVPTGHPRILARALGPLWQSYRSPGGITSGSSAADPPCTISFNAASITAKSRSLNARGSNAGR